MKNITYEVHGNIVTFFVDGVMATSVKTDNIKEAIRLFTESIEATQNASPQDFLDITPVDSQ